MEGRKRAGGREGRVKREPWEIPVAAPTHEAKLTTCPPSLLPVLPTSSCLGHPHSQGDTRRHGPQPAFGPLLYHISLPHKRGPEPVIVRREGAEAESRRVRLGGPGASSVGGAGGRGGGEDGRRGRDSGQGLAAHDDDVCCKAEMVVPWALAAASWKDAACFVGRVKVGCAQGLSEEEGGNASRKADEQTR